MRILECVGRFRFKLGPAYNPGECIAVSDAEAEKLLATPYWRPDPFRDQTVQRQLVEGAAVIATAAVDHPPQDKMLRKPETKKGRA